MAVRIRIAFGVIVMLLVCGHLGTPVRAGMPAVLPTEWTADNTPDLASHNQPADEGVMALRVQTISFFLAVLLASGWFVKTLWNVTRRDFPQLPELTYGRSLGLVGLWGLAFVIVLTMISGARELMTPGAWRKQGWTYQLAGQSVPAANTSLLVRQQHLERLRTALWQYAATHEGRLPPPDEPTVDGTLWNIPGWPGLRYLFVPDRHADSTGRLFVFEPDLEGDERMVLLTNGFIGTMNTAAIKQSLSEAREQQAAGTLDEKAPSSVGATP
jgi:hypothetical protein